MGLSVAWMVVAAGVASATDYTWTGGGADHNWTTTDNWQGGTGFPGVAGDTATVTAANTVNLNTNGIVTLRRLSLAASSAKTVTITGDAGAGFTFTGPADGATGINVANATGNRLIIEPDITMYGRFDKQNSGMAEFKGRFFSSFADGYSVVLRAGQTILSENASLTNLSGTVNLGVGAPASLLLTNQAVCAVNNLNLGISGNLATRSEVIMNSPSCSMALAGALQIGLFNTGATLSDIHDVFRLKSGSLTVSNLLIGCAADSYGAFEMGGGQLSVGCMTVGVKSTATFTMTGGAAQGNCLAMGPSGDPGTFDISGGELIFTTNYFRTGSFRQTGGRSVMSVFDIGMENQTPDVTLAGGLMLLTRNVTASLTAPDKQTFRLGGGLLQITNSIETQIPVRLMGGTVTVDTPLTTDCLVLRRGLFGTGHLIKTGTGAISLGYSGFTNYVSGEVTVSNGVLTLPGGVAIESDGQTTNALKLTICNGGTFRISEISSVVSVPLDLDIKTGGKLEFYGNASTSYNRNMVVARTFSTNGVPLSKGKRYTSGALSAFISASTDTPSCSVIVPVLWTGAGDGMRWQDGANWEGGVVPNGSDAVADLSLATENIQLDSDVTLTCLVYSPQTSKRELTLTGTGALSINWTGSGYFAPCVFVSGGRKLVLDVSLGQKAGSFPFAIVGGGTVAVRKGFMNVVVLDSYAPCSVFGNLAFGGATTLAGNLYIAGHEISGVGSVTFGKDCVLNCARIVNGVKGFMAVTQIHDGADVTCERLWLTKHFGYGTLLPTYKMLSGTLTVTDSVGINVGVVYPGVSSWSRMSGGLFEMTGGTVRTTRIALDLAVSGVTLNGGTVYLGSGGIVGGSSVAGTVKLGGVTIVSESDWCSSVPMMVSGVNGYPTIDTQDHTVTLNGALSGVGGLVKTGTGILSLNGTNTFTGTLVVAGGAVVFGTNSVLNGVSGITVTNGTLMLNGTVLSSVTVLRVTGTDSLVLATGKNVSVDRLYINGVLQSAGTYSFGDGTVTVNPTAKIVWTGAANDGALWSTLNNWSNTAAIPDGADVALDFGYSSLGTSAQIVLDVTPGVTLTNLTYDNGTPGSTLTLTCPPASTNTLTFPANGVIRVAEDQTLVLDTDVYLQGRLYKYGTGTLVLNRHTYATVTGDWLTDFYHKLIVMEGQVIGRGEFSALSVQPASRLTLAALPEFVLEGERAVIHNNSITLPGYENQMGDKGVFTQTGGTVDLSDIANVFKGSSTGFIVASSSSASWINEGFYNLEGGVLITCSNYPAYVSGNYARGTINQSGGTSTFFGLRLTQFLATTGVGEMNLSGGTLRLSGTVEKGWGNGTVNLSGGQIVSLLAGDVFAAEVPVTLATGGVGDVAFAQAASTQTNSLPGTLSGAGGLVQEGPGTLALNGGNAFSGSVTVKGGYLLVSSALTNVTDVYSDGGLLALQARVPALTNLSVRAAGAVVKITGSATPFASGLTLSLARGIVTELDFVGIVDVDRLVLDGRARGPGLYGAAGSGAPVQSAAAYFSGTGVLRVLNGPPPQGTMITLQ
jgi:autotransporter-associated beta strand protein